jgi:hypothetical protein
MRPMGKHNRTTRQMWWVLPGAIALGIVGWSAVRALQPQAPVDRFGPIGGPSIAQDVKTLAGRRAEAFSLPDAGGKIHAVAPGQRRRPIVVNFHMGFY